ncbi:MAG: hypothetical protein GX564_14360, partial [Oligosphaeraceae bacterium]|nr:hypothetical protein [Oligosphaeraceae bacterium]
MKNKLLLLAFLCGLSAFAAFQYEIVTVPYDNSHYEGTGGNYFHINVTSGSGTFYIVDKINNLYSMPGNSERLALVMSDYGYINMVTGDMVSGTGDTIITKEYQESQWNDRVYQTGYEVGTFSDGDSFGLWIANLNGTINTSIYTPYSNYGNYGLAENPDAFGTVLAELDYSTSPSAIFFGITGFQAEAPPVSGQPLPGTLASLALVA